MPACLARLSRPCLMLLLACTAVAALRADLALAPLFTDGVVLQRDKPVPIWGTAAPREVVTVTFAGQAVHALANADGRWIAYLDPLAATTAGADLTVSGAKETRVVHDVVVGEVWLCVGQSNLEFPVRRATDGAAEIAAAHYPLLREVRIEQREAVAPALQVPTGGWQPATPVNVAGFSAIAYFFARDVQRKLDVPVGVIVGAAGGTPIEAWMSPMALASDPAFAPSVERLRQIVADYPSAQAAYDAKLAAWNAGQKEARAKGEKNLRAWEKANPPPWPPPGPECTPAGLFNGMINPLLPGAIRGILWYQGESNADRASGYHALFAALITAWRAHFGQGDLPFFWVNLPAFQPNDPTDLSWAFLREAQTRTLSLPNTGQAVAIDLGDAHDVHPPEKRELARRLALLAQNRVYDITCDDSGPVFSRASPEGSAMRVHFDNADGGLIARDRPPQALELAGADRVFHAAVGRIDHGTLVVRSPAVKAPVAVRYAWHNAPAANLYSGAGLPVVPFRSDNW